MLRTLALIALAPALAFAKTSVVARDARAAEPRMDNTARVVIGRAGDDIVVDKLRAVTDDTRIVRIVLTLSTSSSDRRQAVIPLALPTGARIVSAAVAIGNEARSHAIAMEPAAAREEYETLFRVAKDPLLVEMVGAVAEDHAIDNDAFEPDALNGTPLNAFLPTPPRATEKAGFESYVVRAFPLADREGARIELSIQMPDDAERVVIDHTQRIGRVEVQSAREAIRVRARVSAPIAFALPAVERSIVGVAKVAARERIVDATHSLYAGWAPAVTQGRGQVPTIRIDGGPIHGPYFSVDKLAIRRVVKQHRAQLARCYTKVTEYRGGQEGTAVLHFFIATSGAITSAEVDGELDDRRITDCLGDVVAQWQFPPGDTGVMVHYPLTFQLAR